jgi:hypothetical protein
MSRRADIPGHPGYQAGVDGSIWSARTYQGTVGTAWRKLRGRADKDGYLSVVLYRSGRRTQRKVAHLILLAFVGPQPPGHESCHFPDPSPANNALTNLRWGRHADNIADKLTAGSQARGIAHGMVKLSEAQAAEIRASYVKGKVGYVRLGAQFGVSANQIRLIIKRKNWKHI